MSIHLEIVTPERKVFSDDVANVYLPGADGEMGVLSLHEALVTALVAGELRYEKDGRTEEFAIGGGFAEVTQHAVTVLTDSAAQADEIDEAVVAAAIERAKTELEGIDLSKDPAEHQRAQEVLLRNEALLRLVTKTKG